MKSFNKLSVDELRGLLEINRGKLERYKDMNLKLDMSRGKPSPEQLDLSGGLIDCLTRDDYLSADNIDCRNYGTLDGLPEMKRIYADILGIEPDELVIGGNSSLSMMFDNVAVNMTHGVRDGDPWRKQGKVKFICPVPGYDRHFAICEYFHIMMIPVPMTPDGPDMDEVEALVSSDPMIKGMWCVPVFSNPDGCVYSAETVKRIAGLHAAAADFRIYWDNAYCIHNFRGERPVIPEIISECRKSGKPDLPYVFSSFSKVSFSGAAVSVIASSKSNCDYIKQRMTVQTICHDKLNQLRHVKFFGGTQGVYRHMEKMSGILRPKFYAVHETLERELAGKGIAEWSDPDGGYFVNVNVYDGCAKRTVALCRETGVTLTGAGATFPYGRDPRDRNIRLAPSYPSLDELKTAMEIFCLSVQISAAEKILEEGKTEKLFYRDAYMRAFEAEVVSCRAVNNGYEIVLDRTAFYPEGGGQPADIGRIGGVPVIDVRERDGRIVHIAQGALPEGSHVSGEIDWPYRFSLMQQHTGEHIVSGLAKKLFGLDNVGFHMGSEFVTIDFNGVIKSGDLRRLEELANEAVYRNLRVEAGYPAPDALAKLNYRSKKELSGEVRIVSVPDYDSCACCGLHTAYTGEVGAIKLIESQSYKGGVRISMLCGGKALADYRQKNESVYEISAKLSAKPGEVCGAADALLAESASLKHKIFTLSARLFNARADAIGEFEKICLFEEDLSPAELKRFCMILFGRREGTIAAVFSGSDDMGYKYAIGSIDKDAGEIGRELAGALAARGGGAKGLVQGAVAASAADISDFFAQRGFDVRF